MKKTKKTKKAIEYNGWLIFFLILGIFMNYPYDVICIGFLVFYITYIQTLQFNILELSKSQEDTKGEVGLKNYFESSPSSILNKRG